MAKKGESTWRSWLVIALIVGILLSLYKTTPGGSSEKADLTLVEFYEAMEKGRIVEPITRVLDRDDGETFLTGEMELNEELNDDGSPKTRKYRVNLVPGENEQLMADLLNNAIKVKLVERESPISPFVTQTLFFIAMLALFYWMFRRVGSGGGRFGMSKSKARLLDRN